MNDLLSEVDFGITCTVHMGPESSRLVPLFNERSNKCLYQNPAQYLIDCEGVLTMGYGETYYGGQRRICPCSQFPLPPGQIPSPPPSPGPPPSPAPPVATGPGITPGLQTGGRRLQSLTGDVIDPVSAAAAPVVLGRRLDDDAYSRFPGNAEAHTDMANVQQVFIADFDNDGLKDIFITNGIKKDFRNKDFFKFMQYCL